MFTTFVDNQTAVDIHVLQGERELVSRQPVARAVQAARHPADAGRPAAHPGAASRSTPTASSASARASCAPAIEQTIEVKPSYGLTDEEVERMLIESFEHAEADVEARLLIEARNEAETVVRATEKSLRSPDSPAAQTTWRPAS